MNSISTTFAPDAHRVTSFDRLMRKRLTESLRYLYGLISHQIKITDKAFESGVKRILDQPILPDCFAAYYELAYSTEAGDFKKSEKLLQEIFSMEEPEGLDIFPFKDREQDIRSLRYVKPVDSDPSTPFGIIPIQTKDFQRSSQMIHDSLEIIKEADPNLYDELLALLKVIMLGAGSSDGNAINFHGASAFELWGAILLNAVEATDLVDIIQTLAHESCHVMLFGFCIDDQLVLNPDSERYPSPLRVDPRPIDGIYHAVYVLARMFYASTAIIEKSSLSAKLIAKADRCRKDYAISFYDGLGTLKKHARYTDNGRELMQFAEEYMNEHAKPLMT